MHTWTATRKGSPITVGDVFTFEGAKYRLEQIGARLLISRWLDATQRWGKPVRRRPYTVGIVADIERKGVAAPGFDTGNQPTNP